MDPMERMTEIQKVFSASSKIKPDLTESFLSFMEKTLGKGELDVKTKSLVALALSLGLQCEWCITYHTKKCLEAGCTESEMMETAYIAAIMAGTPALMNVNIMEEAIRGFNQTNSDSDISH
ncbi:hypothetical protein [Thermoplasma volcanium GSS1]|uniref:Carboxymuconolactone decarboxylase-like domain-containing protein n=1 Tax=Thermoplasma volcanium (strain ATCC 51530 / DSM 4299 / JCM 9571 / NBRC 15438 / GSS1) TaxID=273116 RepID=Q978P3_THEVO|nr:carboxymuconolactone decarboxylase family protein [Thermoplasma volcanium]BAB60514.1 hypothetical protein [Thermoplasma volcanium GSS1]